MTLIPIVISALGTIPKGLEKGLKKLEIRGQVEIIPTTALARSICPYEQVVYAQPQIYPRE